MLDGGGAGGAERAPRWSRLAGAAVRPDARAAAGRARWRSIGTVEEIVGDCCAPRVRSSASATSSCTRRRWRRWRRSMRRTCRHLSAPPSASGSSAARFDPPHVGHVAAAAPSSTQLDLDRLLLVVANDPVAEVGPAGRLARRGPLRPGRGRWPREIPGAEASRLEIDRGGPSYSVDTAEEILAEAGGEPARALPGRRGRPGPRARHLAPPARTSGSLVTLAVVVRGPPAPGADRSPGLAGRTGRRAPGPGLQLGGPRPAGGRAGRSRAWSPKPSSVASAAAVCTLCPE